LRQRFLGAVVARCVHGVIPLISVGPSGHPKVQVNHYLVKNLLQLVLRSLEFKYMHICA